MRVSDFDFDLPEDRIALRPVTPRESAKLLHVDAGRITDYRVGDLPELLQLGDVLVLNETRVLRAALKGTRPARAVGGGGDVTLDINLLHRNSAACWDAFARPAKRLKLGDIIHFSDAVSAVVSGKSDGGRVALTFNLEGEALDAAIDAIGEPPLPPYIARKRGADAQDTDDYQTVFAVNSGSVAAPTAGLHFTDDMLSMLQEKGVEIARLTLHVGAGTFLPVKTDDTDDHDMHSEWFEISAETAAQINAARAAGGRVIAVGTTALRALESATKDGRVQAFSGDTDIFITPGYDFQIVDGLLTNFHLPKSTLFMLVCALAGYGAMRKGYQHAIDNGYRFYSYGDTSLLWTARPETKDQA